MIHDPLVFLFIGQVVLFAWFMVGMCRLTCGRRTRRR